MGAAKLRWIVGVGALVVAALAFYVLMNAGSPSSGIDGAADSQPALDEIDAKSRAAMRELLRDAGEE